MLTKPLISDIFVETKAVKRVRDAIEFSMISPYPSHIISAPGRGKTTALYHLTREYDGAYIEIGAQQKSMGGMYRGIAEAIGATLYGNFEREVLDAILRQFERRARYSGAHKDLLVVDEFQTMEDPVKRELLRIHETCGFALVLGGNAERIASAGKKDPLALRQIETRIGARFFLPNLDNEDCDMISEAYGVQGEAALSAARMLGSRSNARELSQILLVARHAAKGQAVGLADIRNALIAVTGKTDSLKSLDRAKR